MIRARQFACWGLLLLFPNAWAEHHPDPLTPPEIDQLRDAALDAGQRLNLYVKFARTRLDALEQVRSDPKVLNRAQETHDRLQNFLDIYDELNDNIDSYDERKADLRKVLKTIIEADTEFQAKLRAFKDSAGTNKNEAGKYEFLLSSALETLDSSAQDHRQLLAEQEEAAKRKKKNAAQK